MTEPIFKEIRNRNILLLVIIGVVSVLIRLLMEYGFDRSALLYVGIPFLIAIILLFIERPEPPHNRLCVRYDTWLLFCGHSCVVT